MNLNVNMTVNLSREDVEKIIAEYIKKEFPNTEVSEFIFNLTTEHYDERWSNPVKSFSSCDVKLKVDKTTKDSGRRLR